MNPFVRIVGATALLGGCPPTHTVNPPEPPPVANPPAPEPPPTANPPAPENPVINPPMNPPVPSALPTWDQVESGHPEGATNPPFPTLYVARDTGSCFKAWLPGMIRPADDILEVHGRVYAKETEVSGGTKVVCPEGQPAGLLADWDKALAEGRIKK